MNPQKIELICSYHLGQEVIMIDQTSKIYGSSRALCVICIQNISQKQRKEPNPNHQSKFDWIGIEQFQLRVAQYEKEKEIEIKEIFEDEKKRLKDIKKLLTTLRDETIQDLNKMILIIKDNLNSLNQKICKEIINLKEFCNIMSYTKLIDVAETLADKKKQDSIILQIKQKQEELILQLTNSQQILLDNFLKKLNSIFKPFSANSSKSQIVSSLYQTLPKNFEVRTIKDPKSLPHQKIDNGLQNQKTIIKSQSQQLQILPVQQQPAQQLQLGDLNHVVRESQIIQSAMQLKPQITGSQIIQPKKAKLRHTLQDQQNTNQAITIETFIDCQMECQILVSNALYSLIICGVGNEIMIWEQIENNFLFQGVCQAHVDLITGLAVYTSQEMIVSGSQDKFLILWKKNEEQNWSPIQKQEQNQEIMNLILTLEEQQLIVSFRDFSVRCYSVDFQCNLSQTQQINLSQEIQSLSVNIREEYLAIACQEKLFRIYNQQMYYWNFSFNVTTEGVVQQLYFTDEMELICQQSMPPLIIVYSILDDKCDVIQKINFFSGSIFESFPIFQINKLLCCQFGKMIYLIKKDSGAYEVKLEIFGDYEVACSDTTGNRIILKDHNKKQIQICSFN